MPSTLAVAWRMVFKRLAADWLILTAAVVTIVLATVLLSSGPIYADAVTLSALQRSLAEAQVRDAYMNIGKRVHPDSYQLADQLVTRMAEETFISTSADVLRHTESESFELPTQNSEDMVDLAAFQYFENIADHATLIEGKWPGPTTTPFETVVLVETAEMLGLGLDDEFAVTNRRDATFRVGARIVGIYRIDDPSDPFWFEDPLALGGVTKQTAFRTFGPFVVDRESMVKGFTRDRLSASWRVLPHYENLTASDIAQLRSRVFSLEERLNTAFAKASGDDARRSSEFLVATGLTILLGETGRSLTVTRTSVLALLVQLAILAGYALALTAGLLVGARRTETNLLRSRGASPNQLLTIAVLEGVLLTVPAVLAAPWLASAALDALNSIGPLSSIRLVIEFRPTAEAYILAGVAAVGAVVALSWPAYRSAKHFPDSSYERRQRRRSPAQRAGGDIALLALTAIVFWQLQSLGPRISATIKGRFGVDPLLIMAPALGLLAGAVLALRMIPLMARMAEQIAATGRSTVSALSAWQVARRPVRYARSALLLIMAISIGFFAAAFSTTWVQSQKDQAEFQVGADIRLIPNRRTNDSIADAYLPKAHETVRGVTTSMAVVRKRTQLSRSGEIGQFMFIDASRSAEVVLIRDDLAPDFDALMTELTARRPTMASVSLPGEPTRIGLVMAAREEWLFPTRYLGPDPHFGFDFRVSVIIQDGDGLLHKVGLGSIPVNIGRARLEADLTYPLADGSLATPRFPLSLVDIEILSPIPLGAAHHTAVDFAGIFVSQAETGWQRVPVDLDSTEWEINGSTARGRLVTKPTITYAASLSPTALSVDINTGATLGSVSPPLYFTITPRGTELPETFPIVVTESFLESNATDVGKTLQLSGLRIANDKAEIVGTVVDFPTVDSSRAEIIVIDLPTFQMMTYRPGVSLEPASEYWLATIGENDGYIESELFGPQFESVQVNGAEDRARTLISDPVALGTIGALTLGFVAAAVFATVGFAASATVSARERIREFALLRALGLSPKQFVLWLSLEQGVLVVLSLALGTLVGIVLTALILPLVSLTQEGSNAIPELIVLFPWRTVLQLELAVVAILGALVIIMTFLLRRLGLSSLLRLGDD